jgi:hypothetical protein
MKVRKWARYSAHKRYMGNLYKILVGEPERKRSDFRLDIDLKIIL